jgi:hypothetical protein
MSIRSTASAVPAIAERRTASASPKTVVSSR